MLPDKRGGALHHQDAAEVTAPTHSLIHAPTYVQRSRCTRHAPVDSAQQDLLALLDEQVRPPSTPLAAIRRAVDLLTIDIDAARDLLQLAIRQLVAPAVEDKPGAVRRDAPVTSRIAARAVRVRSGSQRARVLIAIREVPSTDSEIQQRLGVGAQTQTARRGELAAAGLVEPSGAYRPTPSGHPAIIWTLTDLGRAVAAELDGADGGRGVTAA